VGPIITRIREIAQQRSTRRPGLKTGTGVATNRDYRKWGKGGVAKRVADRIKTASDFGKARKPDLLPKVMERLGTYQAGRRIQEMLPRQTADISASVHNETAGTGARKKRIDTGMSVA